MTNSPNLYLHFYHCNIGNDLAKTIASLPCEKLQELLLVCDPLSNKGLKNLIRLDMPNLQLL